MRFLISFLSNLQVFVIKLHLMLEGLRFLFQGAHIVYVKSLFYFIVLQSWASILYFPNSFGPFRFYNTHKIFLQVSRIRLLNSLNFGQFLSFPVMLQIFLMMIFLGFHLSLEMEHSLHGLIRIVFVEKRLIFQLVSISQLQKGFYQYFILTS